jgi:23S rRNA pseudouridine1911/1915/1917 synthase
MPQQTHEVTVTPPQVGRVDHIVRDLTGLPRSQVDRLFQNKCVRVNGKVCIETFFRIAVDDKIAVQYDPKSGYQEKKKAWTDRAFEVVFEDSWIIVVDKKAGVLSLPTQKSIGNTLFDRLKLYLNHSRSGRDCFVVHRLDREISGLLVFAKSNVGAELLQSQFTANGPIRKFTAIVNGIVEPQSGTFESYLATASNLDQYNVYNSKDGQLAVTNYRVITTKLDTTVVELELKTARRHQMRVHLADAGHPILADPRYGKKQSLHRNWKKKRMAIHGHFLEFLHPENGERMTFQSPIPQALKRFRPQPIEDEQSP